MFDMEEEARWQGRCLISSCWFHLLLLHLKKKSPLNRNTLILINALTRRIVYIYIAR